MRLAKAAVPVEEILSVPPVLSEVVALSMSAVSWPVTTPEANEATPAPEILSVPEVLKEVVAFRMSAESVPVYEADVPVRPAIVRLPEESTLNLVEEFTCRSMKLPVKLVGLAPSQVPEAAPLWILLGPSCTKDVEVESWGLPERSNDCVPEAVPVRRPAKVW